MSLCVRVCLCVYERERGREKAVSNALIPDCSVTRLKLWESVTLSFVMLMSVSVCMCVQEVLAVDTQVKRGSGTDGMRAAPLPLLPSWLTLTK